MKGLETFSSRFFLEAAAGSQPVEITADVMRCCTVRTIVANVFGAVLAYGPILRSDEHTRPLLDAVSRYALCGKAPLLRELEIPAATLATPVRVRIEVRPGIPVPNLPLILEAPCP